MQLLIRIFLNHNQENQDRIEMLKNLKKKIEKGVKINQLK